jgi:GH24 family phage-related lysozyme (muramidase)
MVKGHLPCFPLAAAQSLLSCNLESSRTTKRLNSNDWKQAIETINKTVYQKVPKY